MLGRLRAAYYIPGVSESWITVYIMILFMVANGLFRSYRSFQRDSLVTKVFDDNALNPEYQYFYHVRIKSEFSS